jgi:flavin reductase (DIM6/NTAB) family NADH-FMN oxidoreductase RutF
VSGSDARHEGDDAMKAASEKIAFPASQVRRYLEPGPIVLVSSRWRDRTNIMTMGWHTVMEFTPSLVGCVIAGGNHSFDMIRQSRECVINLPTTALTDQVVGIGNTSGGEIDKFAAFGLTADTGAAVDAPLIRECHANFECRLHDDALVERYNFFIFEVVHARALRSPRHPRTLHYTGDGVFMVAGKIISRRSKFRPGML